MVKRDIWAAQSEKNVAYTTHVYALPAMGCLGGARSRLNSGHLGGGGGNYGQSYVE